ncbi:MAG: hypoxanthine phosphoribosyltransferase [Desulfobacterium sp.]|nr:hypoxanthine phosphoribosyltransferase [Desulfobacterium sp.]
MPELVPVLSKDEIREMVSVLARKISSEYEGRSLVLIGVLKGAFIFLADLTRNITIPHEIDFLRAASYGSGTTSSEKIKLTKKVETKLHGKDVLLVEDIIDTGITLEYLIEYVKSLQPASIKVCTLIDKHQRRQKEIKIDYAAHIVQEGFLVGYGMDYAEGYRNLPDIYHLKL